jgi:hypothetical protein
VKPRLQARLYDSKTAALGPNSFAQVAAPFGQVHALLLNAGRGLTSAFVYTEALPEHVIAARLRWRQGGGAWRVANDDIYPYEFSPDLRDDGGDFECIFDVEYTQQQVKSSPPIVLSWDTRRPEIAPGSEVDASIVPVRPSPTVGGNTPPSPAEFRCDDAFVAYLQRAANGNDFGRRSDERYYPYSTPQGRRIAWRQPVWDKALFTHGCTAEDAEQHLRAELSRVSAELRSVLAARAVAVNLATLDQRQQETLIDLAFTEGVTGLRAGLIDAVLARDWTRMTDELLYVRYAGHVPDHARNKAFAQRWHIP